MKKICLSVFLFIVFLLAACSNNNQVIKNGEQDIIHEEVDNSSQNIFENCEIADAFIEIYDDKGTQFQQFFSPDEYVKLCSIAEKMSAELCYAISSSCVLISQNISTYNTNQNFYYVIDKVVPKHAVMRQRKGFSLYMTEERMVVIVLLRTALRRQTRVSQDDMSLRRNPQMQSMRRQRTLIDLQPTRRIIGNTGGIGTTYFCCN